MDTRELQIWQPVTCLVKGNVVTAKLEHGDTDETAGLRLELTDIDGNVVQIVYDKISPIMHDYIWTYRYVNEIKRCDLNKLIDKADHSKIVDPAAHHFYKMVNSDLIQWYDQLPWLGSTDEPNVEHHIYMYNEGVFEIVSDYEPRFIVKLKGK